MTCLPRLELFRDDEDSYSDTPGQSGDWLSSRKADERGKWATRTPAAASAHVMPHL